MTRLALLCLAAAFLTSSLVQAAVFDDTRALRVSQNAIGGQINDLSFRDSGGKTVRLSDFRGKPLLVNFIYTSCAHSCSVVTRYLADVYENARDVFDPDSFNAISVGFDAPRDTPGRMRSFARGQGVEGTPGWYFLSADAETIKALERNTGFVQFKTAKGFDHLEQVTIIDGTGKVTSQVYGATFDRPLLMEPMKELIFGTPAPYRSLADLIKKVRLFCTLYDPAADRYKFDYSLFIQISAGVIVIGSVIIILVREIWGRRNLKNGSV
jgi:protein SCO1/2